MATDHNLCVYTNHHETEISENLPQSWRIAEIQTSTLYAEMVYFAFVVRIRTTPLLGRSVSNTYGCNGSVVRMLIVRYRIPRGNGFRQERVLHSTQSSRQWQVLQGVVLSRLQPDEMIRTCEDARSE